MGNIYYAASDIHGRKMEDMIVWIYEADNVKQVRDAVAKDLVKEGIAPELAKRMAENDFYIEETCIHELETMTEHLKDMHGKELVDIAIREDGKVIWVNTEKGCVLRICKIQHLNLDDRRKLLMKVSTHGVEECHVKGG